MLVDRWQADFGEQLLESRITVKAGETLVNAKIQHVLVMRLDADGQVSRIEGFALRSPIVRKFEVPS